jgi:hypothetical protein
VSACTVPTSTSWELARAVFTVTMAMNNVGALLVSLAMQVLNVRVVSALGSLVARRHAAARGAIEQSRGAHPPSQMFAMGSLLFALSDDQFNAYAACCARPASPPTTCLCIRGQVH